MELGESFRTVLEAVPDAMLVVDEDGRIVLVNDEAERIFGYDRADIVDRCVDLLVPDAARRTHAAHRAHYRAHPATRRMGAGLPLEGRRQDGTTFPAEISLSSLATGAGRLVFAAVRDVTGLRQAEARFRGLLEAAPDAMVMVDAGGLVTMVNGQAESLFGWGRDELLGQTVEMLVPDSVRDVQRRHRDGCFADPAGGPMGGGLELEGRRKDGTTFPAEISLSAFETEGGLVVSASVRDATARKAAEHEARAAREEAERANRAKSEFLSRMSHELRTPLNAILGFAQLLEYNHPRPDQAEQLEYILKGGRHLLGLIDEVLDISRIEAGHLALAVEAVTVADVVRETIDLVMPLAMAHQVSFRVDPDAPADAAVLADRQRLKQVMLNLASNAVKYNRVGGEVRISWCAEGAGDVRVQVHDTGIGIRPELMDRLFQPFERLDQGGSGIGGTGLGLALSRGLAQGMDGRMGAESRHRQGSTFWVQLRATDAVPAGAGAGAERAAPQVTGPPRPAGRRILYVEDNLSNLRLVESILRQRPGIELVPTLQGSMALELARRHDPDLVLLDLHLPDLTGEEVFDRLRSDPATAAIPIVVVSADALPARVEALLARGAFGYVTKPLDVARFLEIIDRALATVTRPGAQGSSV
jgi:protein-histidine pros-kinase